MDNKQQTLSPFSTSKSLIQKLHYSSFGASQSCAMCLAIICGHPLTSPIKLSTSLSPKFSNPSLTSSARKFFFELGGNPTLSQPTLQTTTIDSQKDVVFSGRHDGFALYLTRILKPLWARKIFILNVTKLECQFSSKLLIDVARKLESLISFLEM